MTSLEEVKAIFELEVTRFVAQCKAEKKRHRDKPIMCKEIRKATQIKWFRS